MKMRGLRLYSRLFTLQERGTWHLKPFGGFEMVQGMQRSFGRVLHALVIVLLASAPALAEVPPGYYSSVDAGDGTSLRLTLHDVIDDHTRFPYTSSSTDTWDILNQADEDPNNPANVVDIYKNASYTKIDGGTGAYNREHSWPKSYGFPDDNSGNYPYTDCHHLFVSDASYNSSRSNNPFQDCHGGCDEKPTEYTDGRGGGTGVYPGNSNWRATDVWETWGGRRGDVARALFYMAIRYEGGTHGVTGRAEPDLELTDSMSLIEASSTGNNESVAYMGMLSDLLAWHAQDPVDDRERYRNDVVYSYQGNRNPFIDHPEWVECVFLGVCSGGDTTPPAAPTGLVASGGTAVVDLDWNDNSETDLAGYNVFRSTSPSGDFYQVNTGLLTASSYVDMTVTGGVTYYYVVAAVDTSDNESDLSTVAFATPSADCTAGPAFEGAISATPVSASSSIRLDWDAATPLCSTGVTYTVYRSTSSGLTPSASNVIATCITDLLYDDTGVAVDQTYYYVVRAEEGAGGGTGQCSGGYEDDNLVEVSAVLTSSGEQVLLDETFDAEGWPAWDVTTGPGPHSCGDWALSTSSSQRPPSSTGNYALADSDACGGGSTTSTALMSPEMNAAGASELTLEFDLYYRYYNGDDASVEVWDGFQWVAVWSDSNQTVEGRQTVDVTAWANEYFTVRFNYQNAAWDWWFAVDNVKVTLNN